MRTLLLAVSVLSLAAACGRDRASAPPAAAPSAPVSVAASAPVAPRETLEAMRAQFAIVDMNPDLAFLTGEERAVVNLLNEAGDVMSAIYRQQISEDNETLRTAIAAGDQPDKELLLDLVDLHFGPWDTLNDDKPFYGSATKPAGAAFYPADMTKEEFEAHLAANPADKAAFISGYTVIRRDNAGRLIAIPYSEYYREPLEAAASLLKRAAEITTNASLKKFLSLRADAFLTDDYFASEIAWMDLDGTIEVAIGPYEVYTDGLFGYKTAFEAFVTVKDPAESAALDKYKKYLRDMEANLPVPEGYKNFKRGFESPIAVVTQVHGGGDNVPGVQTIAFNLPNDERVREAKGAKKVLLNNVMSAKFDRILAPMASVVLVPEHAAMLLQKYMGAETLFHELSHSLGPGAIVKNGAATTVNAELKELYSATEEGKADVMGAYNILFMMEKGELPAVEKEQFLATYFVGLFRAMRFGVNEAHGRGAAFQYEWFRKAGALSIDEETGKFRLDFPKLEAAIGTLTKEIVILQGDGDYAKASAFLDRWAVLDAPANAVIASLDDVPVDIQPVYQARLK
ncbi:MAG: dipeptidyl-peptidase 3 family protein [Parvularculaceae bacterium]